jgi:MFS transporter, putative metabolite:H+ symporter
MMAAEKRSFQPGGTMRASAAPPTAPLTPEAIVARIERLPVSPWHVKMRAIIATATFFDSFDALTIAFVAPALIGLWHLRPTDIGILIASGFIGQALGGFGFGWAAERWGRLPVLLWTIAIFSILSLASAAAWGFASLFVLRLAAGFGLGGELPVAITYINEFAKAEKRGWFVLIYQSIYPVGIVAVSLVAAWVVPHFGWQWMFVIGAVPALLVIPLRRMLPESPRWLATHGRLAEADRTLKTIEDKISDGGRRPLPPPAANIPRVATAKASWRDLFSGIYLRRTITLWIFSFIATFVGFGVTLWLPTIYKTVFKLPDQQALLLSVFNNVALMLGVLTCSFLVDRLGRRVWFTTAFTCTAIPLLIVFAMGTSITVTAMMVMATIASFFLAQCQLGMTLYPTELYPTRIRALGAGLTGIFGRTGSIVGPPLIGLVLQEASLGADFLMLAAAALVAAAIMWLYGTETRGRLLEELSP